MTFKLSKRYEVSPGFRSENTVLSPPTLLRQPMIPIMKEKPQPFPKNAISTRYRRSLTQNHVTFDQAVRHIM